MKAMNVGQKATLSLLISTLLASAFAVLAFSGLFNIIEADFFDARVRSSVDSSLDALADSSNAYHTVNLDRFSTLLDKDYVKRSFLPNQSSEDLFQRTSAFGILAEEISGLLGVRFIDLEGRRIHYSSFPADTLRAEPFRTIYRNYGEGDDEAYDGLAVRESEAPRISSLPQRRAYAYRFPFTDSFGIYRGTAVFYLSYAGLVEHLVRDRRIGIDEAPVPVGEGIVFGVPSWSDAVLMERLTGLWASGPSLEPLPLGSSSASDNFILFSRGGIAGPVGRLVPATWFHFPAILRWLLLAAFYVTAYLLIFLLLNLKQDRMAVLSHRIKHLQLSMLEEYLDKKGELDSERLKRELEARRGEVKDRMQKGLGSFAKRHTEQVDSLINKGWDEIIGILAGRPERAEGLDLARIESLLKEALSKGSFVIGSAGSPQSQALALPGQAGPGEAQARPASRPSLPVAKAVEEAESVEDIESLEEAESVEEVEEAESFEEAEEAESLEEIEEAVSIEEAELTGESEPIEEAESIKEAEALAELEPSAEAEAVEELEELEEFEEAGSVGEAEAMEEAEALVGREPAAEAEAVEELEELEEFEEAGSVGEAEAMEDAEALAEREPAAEAEAVEELEEFEGLVAAEPADIGIERAAPAETGSSEELEDLEELSEELDAEQETWGSLSAEALALASQEEDDLPIIPESLGLELVEETNLSDIMGYMDARPMEAPVVTDELELSEEQRAQTALEELEFDEAPLEPMVFASPFDALADGDLHIPADSQIDIQPLVAPPAALAEGKEEFISHIPASDAPEAGSATRPEAEPNKTAEPEALEEASELEACEDGRQNGDECLDEVEFELFLECLDLSGLNGYRDEEGFLELDDESYFASHAGVDEQAVKDEEAIDQAIVLDEAGVALLSDEDRERIEELQVMVEEDDGLAALELESLGGIGYTGAYVPIRRAAPYRLSPEELIAIEDAEPGTLLSLEEARDASEVIDMIDGIFVLNRDALQDAVPADPALKALADEVLHGPSDKR
jgi:hypothetical protein